METFKKGQLVPRRLQKILAWDPKCQYGITFGCDVEINGDEFKALSSGPMVILKNVSRRMNNGTYKKSGILMQNCKFLSMLDFDNCYNDAIMMIR
jgi:hypothetical protein